MHCVNHTEVHIRILFVHPSSLTTLPGRLSFTFVITESDSQDSDERMITLVSAAMLIMTNSTVQNPDQQSGTKSQSMGRLLSN